jgi:zinc/manganese transport system permease protein
MLTPRPPAAMFVSTVISLVSVWLGVGLSAMFNLPPSFLIITIACTVWLVVWVVVRRVRPASKAAGADRPSAVGDHAHH